MRADSPSVDIVMAGTFATWRLGTLQSRALPLARALRARGVRCAIVTVPVDMPAESRVSETVDGVPIYNARSVGSLGFPLAMAEQLRIVHALRPGAIHVFKPKGYGGLAGRILSRTIPLVVDSDDWEGDGGWNQAGSYSVLQRRLFHWQETSLLCSADAVTAASVLLACRASRLRVGLRDDRVTWLPNGLDATWAARLASARSSTTQVGKNEPTSVVLYSRFAEFPSDWLSTFLQALVGQIQSTVRPHARPSVIIIGPSGLKTLVGVQGLDVDLMGYVAHDAIPQILARASVAVYPYVDSLISRSKNSVKLLELMAAGCAIVASRVGDVPAVADETALLLDDSSPASFAAAIADLVSQPDEVRRLSTAAQARASSFTIDRVADRLHDVYAAVGSVGR